MLVMEPRIYTHIKSVLCQDIIYKREIKNIMQLPLPLECALNSSSAYKTRKDGGFSALLPGRIALEIVSGFKNKSTRSGKSASTFQLKKNVLLGTVVNLRGKSLYFFLDQFISAVSPSAVSEKINNSIDMPTKNSLHVDYNAGSKDFAFFPGLQANLFLLSTGGGFNCTLRTSSSFYGEKLCVCTAIQIPV